MPHVKTVPCLEDNYAYILYSDTHQDALVIDAPEASSIIEACQDLGKTPTHLLITHHHPDHTAGIDKLCESYGCRVIAPQLEKDKIPQLNYGVADKSYLNLSETHIQVLQTPGHTKGHVVYYLPEEKLLFSGDTLFSLGCGKALEQDPEILFESLQKIKELPEDTTIYFGHEYTLKNLEFSQSLCPSDDLSNYRQELENKLKKSGGSIPTTLAFEKKYNLFLNTGVEALKKALNLEGQEDEKMVFAALRDRKDHF